MKASANLGKTLRLLGALTLGLALTAGTSWLLSGPQPASFVPAVARAAAARAAHGVSPSAGDGARALVPPDGHIAAKSSVSAVSRKRGLDRVSDPAPADDPPASHEAPLHAPLGQPSASSAVRRPNSQAIRSFRYRDSLGPITAGLEWPSGGRNRRTEHDEPLAPGAAGIATIGLGVEGDDAGYGTRFDVPFRQDRDRRTQVSSGLAAPELRLEKWNTSGHARPGGVVVYGVYYENSGDGSASETRIADTLPMSTSYAGDTSGLPVVEAGGVITWDLGEVAPGDQGVFMVTLNIPSTVPTGTGVIGQNCALITTSTPGDPDPGNDEWCADPVDVWEDDVEVGVQKWAHPDDPTPGQEFEYEVQWCNNRGAAVGPLWLTDTLPISTTFVSWRPEPWYNAYWIEVMTTGGQVVLYAPGYPGDACDQLNVRLLLDSGAQVSTTLENSVMIHAYGDVDPENDERTNQDAHVSPPRYDMRADKWLNTGVLVPGGWIEYGIWYENRGNSAVPAWVTDTLPEGTSFVRAWRWGPEGEEPLEPVEVTGDAVVWDLGIVRVNESRAFNVLLDIGESGSAGEALSNCARVGTAHAEDTPWDNEACVETTLYSGGLPNLHVSKWTQDYRPGNDRISYQIFVGNYGSEPVHNVAITDTFPISTTYEWHHVDWDESEFTYAVMDDEFLVEFDVLDPGWVIEIQLTLRLDDPGARLRWYTNIIEIDTPPGDPNPGDNVNEEVVFSGGEVDRVELDVGGTGIWGEVPEGPVTITTRSVQVVFETDGGFDWNAPDPIEPGDTITIAAGMGTVPVIAVVPDPFDAHASAITDTVWGQVDHLDQEWIEVDLDRGPRREAQTDADGNYEASFLDVPRGAQGEARYRADIGFAEVVFHRHFRTDDLIVTVDYWDDWVGGEYEPGHAVQITVTDDLGLLRAAQSLVTAPMPDWGGQSGFETQWEDWVPGPGIDILPGDYVFALLDNGYTSTVRVGTITASLDLDSDTVSGTISAPWLAPDLVVVSCEIHEQDGQGIEVDGVDPDGGSFYCDFGGRWDIVPGDNVAVNYIEPGRDRVQTHPWNPAPRLGIDKWSVNEAAPSVGGNLVFEIEYRNDGGLEAANTVITDTMVGMTYIADTSGFPHTGTGPPGDPVVWDLGEFAPESRERFQVFAAVTGSVSETITNIVEIATSNPYDQSGPGGKQWEWLGHVVESDTHLNVGKSAWTGDPARDTDFVFQLDVCNDGSTASSAFVLTDTLHPSMTLQTWWAQEPGWEEVARSESELVVSRPSIPSGCDQVFMRVHLTGTAGMPVANTAVFTASNDLVGQGQASWEGEVGEPHTNLTVFKWWDGGQLVRGGELRYRIRCENNGNVPVDGVFVTDTLPVSTTLLGIWQYDRDWNEIGSVTPTFVGSDYVVWEAGTIENGDARLFRIALAVDDDAVLGPDLTNSVEISRLPGEDDYDDNSATWVEWLHDHGPNLRVRKQGSWDDWGEDTRRASYFVTVENVGSAAVTHVTVTDTYSISMDRDGGIETDWERVEGWGNDPSGRFFTVTYDVVWPGEGIHIDYGAIVPGDGPLPFGLAFTNTVVVVLVGVDTNIGDNRDQLVLTTGPDLTVMKELIAGEPRPGEVVTFSLVFRNDLPGHERWWGVQGTPWLTDALPSGVTFITSTLHWCEGTEWCSFRPMADGDDLTWELWPLGAGEWNEIWVTAQLSTTLSSGSVITNTAVIRSDGAQDVEWDVANNKSELPLRVSHPGDPYAFYLPLVMRAY